MESNMIYTVIGTIVVATGAGAVGREFVSRLMEKRNNNGNGKTKFNPENCVLHSLQLQAVEIETASQKKQLENNKDEFKEIRKNIGGIEKHIGSIENSMAVLAERAKNRRAGD